MDPPQPPSPSLPPPPPQSAASTKLRLMCSYGGQITPRPRTKSLCYLGGETRIISVNPAAVNTLSAFISHLLTILAIKPPFTLKYQLPHSALDSLISLSSDDDLQFMLCEHLRLSSSTSPASAPSRIRLFVFFPEPEKPTTAQNVIHHPKTEAWFVDALESAKILQKGRDCSVGFDGEGLIGENEGKGVGDLGNGGVSLAESMVLETSSSFGSSSSSASSANVPLIKPLNEDFAFSSLDNAVKLQTTCDSVASEIAATNSCSSVENAVMSIPVISESHFHDPAAGIHPQNVIDFSGYALAPRPNSFQPQALKFVQAGTPVESCLPAMFPMSSYYPVQQPQFLRYQPMPNHMYPVYFFPVGQTQVSAPSKLPTQWGLHDAATGSLSHTLVSDASPVLPQVSYKEVMPEPHPQNFGGTPPLANPVALEPADEVRQQPVSISNDAAVAPSGEVARIRNECNEDDHARTQIYKSQPPPPLVPSQLQSKANASTTLLSDAMAQLQMIKIKP